MLIITAADNKNPNFYTPQADEHKRVHPVSIKKMKFPSAFHLMTAMPGVVLFSFGQFTQYNT